MTPPGNNLTNHLNLPPLLLSLSPSLCLCLLLLSAYSCLLYNSLLLFLLLLFSHLPTLATPRAFRPLFSTAARRPAIQLAQHRTSLRAPFFRANMSSATETRNEFLCIVPDKPGMNARRIEVRPYVLHTTKLLQLQDGTKPT